MLVSIFLYLIGIFIAFLHGLLSGINFLVPGQVQDSFTYLASYLAYLSPIVNFPGILQAFSWYIIGISAWFTFLGVMWVWHKMPWVGKASKPETKK